MWCRYRHTVKPNHVYSEIAEAFDPTVETGILGGHLTAVRSLKLSKVLPSVALRT